LLGYDERLDEYNDNDPYPVNVLGRVISSDKLRGYFTSEFFYYYKFYARAKRLGNPFNRGWLDWPRWCVQIQMAFDAARDETEVYNRRSRQ
jgi:hypothetical protein